MEARAPHGLGTARTDAPPVGSWMGVLGPVEVRSHGVPVTVGGTTVRLILAHLLLADGATVPDERLMAIWGRESTDPATALRVTITRLRKKLADLPCSLERRTGGYCLTNIEHSDLAELARLEREVAGGDDTTIAGRASIEQACVDAIVLWRGPALADLRLIDAGERVAVPLDRRLGQLRQRLVDVAGRSGTLSTHLGRLTEWVDQEPLDESAAAALASALWSIGQTAAALRALGALRRSLTDVGLDVPHAVRRLEAEILADPVDPVDDEPTVVRPLPSPLRSHGHKRIVGRDDDLERLRHEWTRAELGTSTVVRLRGFPGVGKTALIARFADELRDAGVTVAYASGNPGGDRPFGAVVAWLDQLDVDDDGEGWQVAEADTVNAGARLAELARRSLAAATEARRVLLVLDDLQWADAPSISVMRHLIDHPLPESVLLVGIERDDEHSRLTHRLLMNLDVGPLDADGVESMAGILDGGDAWSARDLLAMTGGLPLLVEEVVRRPVGRRSREPGVVLFEDVAEGLPDESLDTLTLAALFGPGCRFVELAQLSTAPELQVLERVDALIRRGLLIDDARGGLAFAHDLFRRVALQRWSDLRVARMHSEVLTLIDLDSEPTRALHHALGAGTFAPPGVVIQLARRVGGERVAACAWDDALDAYGPSLEFIDDAGVDDAVEILVQAARCSAALDRADDFDRFLERAFAIARAGDSLRARAEALCGLQYRGMRDVPDRTSVEEMLDLVDRMGESVPFADRARYLRLAAWAAIYGGVLDLMDDVGRRLEALERHRDAEPTDVASLLDGQYTLAAATADAARQDEIIRRVERLQSARPDVEIGTAVLLHYLSRGESGVALGYAERWIEHELVGDNPHGEWSASLTRFTEAFVNCRFDAARAHSEACHEFGRTAGLYGVFGAYASQSFALAWVRGELESFIEPLRAVALAEHDLVWRGSHALASAVAGDLDQAARALTDSLPAVADVAHHWLSLVGVVAGVEAAWLADHRAFLERSIDSLERLVGTHVILGHAAMDYGPVDRYLALAVDGLGDRERAVATLERVATDPRSGPVWQDRAAFDLDRLRGEGRPHDPDVAWSWVVAPARPA